MKTTTYEILKAFGDLYYSYGHKGTVNTVTQKRKDNAPEYPLSGEIDLMKYADEDYLPSNYYERVILSSEDILSILWLSKIYVK